LKLEILKKIKWKIGICLEFMTCTKIFSTKLSKNQYILYKISVQTTFNFWLNDAVYINFFIPVSTARRIDKNERNGNEDERSGTPSAFCVVVCRLAASAVWFYFFEETKKRPHLQ